MPAVATRERMPDKGFTENQSKAPAGLSGQDTDNGDLLPVTRLKPQYLSYLNTKTMEIEEQKIARHYFHGAQYTADEIRILRNRKQPIVTYNRTSRKINAIVGLMERLRQDPKGFPRHPRAEDGAEIATSTIRYVLDSNDWTTKSSEVARHAGIDGISGVELKLRSGDKGDPDVQLEIVFGDDFFYDPTSVKHDFHDAMFLGVGKWVHEDIAVDLFPDKEEEIRSLVDNGNEMTTHSDREYKWVLANERRIRLVEHWYKHKGKWRWAFYIGATILDQGTSPFLNERGKTIPRFIMFSAAVDHDGDRYGFVRNLKGPQDEINQRRSKALFISNSRRLIMEKGAVDDVETARREWSRPDGVIEKNPGRDVKPDDTSQDLAAQLAFLQDAKQEIDSSAPASPVMPGSEQMARNTSGRAINMLQQAGTAELGPFIMAYRGWKLSVYRAIWGMAQRYWTGERWIRITNDEGLAQFIKLNGLDVDEFGRPMLVNALGQIDVDIVIDEGPNVANMMADSSDVISDAIRSGTQFPPQVVVEMLPLQSSVKKRIQKMMQPQVDPNDAAAKQYMLEEVQARVKERTGNAYKNVALAAQAIAKAGLDPRVPFLKDTAEVESVAEPPGPQASTPGLPSTPMQTRQMGGPSTPGSAQLPLPLFGNGPLRYPSPLERPAPQ